MAGGQNRRMQQNKAFLKLDGKNFIEKVIEKIMPPCLDLVISSNTAEEYEFLGFKVVPDLIPQRGPLSGVHAGLQASDFAYNFVVPCDMPFLNRELVEFLIEESQGFDVTVPRFGSYPQPLHGVYHKNCIPLIETYLNGGGTKVTGFYPQVKVKFIEEEQLAAFGEITKIFYNVNTPEEFQSAKNNLS